MPGRSLPARAWNMAAAVVAVLLVAACGGQGPSGSAAPSAGGSPSGARSAQAGSPTPSGADAVATIASVVSDDTTVVEMTDWARIRGTTAVPEDPAARETVMKPLFERIGVQSLGSRYFRGHRAAWGWDSLDLTWEALIQHGRSQEFGWVMALPTQFDLGPIAAILTERGFAMEQRGSARVFSHADDAAAVTMFLTWGHAIVNTALLDDRHLIVVSDSRALFDAILARLAASAAPTGQGATFEAMVERLGPVDGLVVDLDAADCARLAIISDPATSAALAGVHPWTALAFGWSGKSAPPTARVVLTYRDATTAAADLALRVRIAGSATFGQVTSSKTDGDTEIIDLSITKGPVNSVENAFFGVGLAFAGCP